MTPFHILDAIILNKKIYIIYFFISLVISFPLFLYFKQSEDFKPKYILYSSTIAINEDVKRIIKDVYQIKDNLEQTFSFYDNNTNIDGVVNFKSTNEFIQGYTEEKKVSNSSATKMYNEMLMNFLQNVASSEAQTIHAYRNLYDKINIRFPDNDQADEAIYELMKGTNLSALNDEFDQEFKNTFENIKINSYLTIKSRGSDSFGDDYFQYVTSLLEDSSKNVHKILLEKTKSEYNVFINRQKLKIGSLKKYKLDLPLKYIEDLNSKIEFLESKLNVATALNIIEPAIGGAGVGNAGVVMNYPSIDKLFMGTTVIKLEIEEINKKIAEANSPNFKSKKEILIDKDIKNNVDHLIISENTLQEHLAYLKNLEINFYKIEKEHMTNLNYTKSTFLILANIFIIQIFFLMLLYFCVTFFNGYKEYRLKLDN
tara:strand:- start:234 stop:1514 length:1281 start_codon:yes stop_codon:yes gene_type:complete